MDIPDEASALTLGNLGELTMTSQSSTFMKLNSNLYCFDGVMFLVYIRMYSGHGTEREEILKSATEFTLKNNMSLNELENYFPNLLHSGSH